MLSERILTVVEKGSRFVWVPGRGKIRRFATLVVLVRAGGTQPEKLIIIMSGVGGPQLQEEAKQYDEGVRVYWQRNAWADGETFRKIVEDLRLPSPFLLFMDNLGAHRLAVEQLEVAGGRCWFGPPNTTDYWQPVDANIGTIYHYQS